MKNRLIPLRERWKEIKGLGLNTREYIGLYNQYISFTGQNLSEPYEVNGVTAHPLNRFFPCDLEGNPFTEIDDELCERVFEKRDKVFDKCMIELAEQYQQAKDRCVFEGWTCEVRNGIHFLNHEGMLRTIDLVNIEDRFNGWTIESLTEYNQTLTPTGAKMCGKEFEK